jgi:hypothetical protein
MMIDYEWLRSLKAGDEVAVYAGYVYGSYTFTTVARTTKTMVVTADGSRYRIQNGDAVGGDSYRQDRLVQPTEELKGKVRQRALAESMPRQPWAKVPLEILEQIQALVAPFAAPK